MRLLLTQILLFAFVTGLFVAPRAAMADWPWQTCEQTGMKKRSPEWWAYMSSLPVGSRQWYRKGKLWPPRPRPTDPQQPVAHQFHAAHYWPHPYNAQDREIVNIFEEAQIAQGWKNATTLYDYHFDPTTQELSRSGKQHLLWILQNAQEIRRVAYIQATTEKHHNDARIASVNQTLASIAGDQYCMPVVLEVTSPVLRPAHEVDVYQRAWIDGMIPPHIPYSVGDTGGGSEE